jgi:UPF0755 protein
MKRLVVLIAALGLVGLAGLLGELYRPYRGYAGSQLVVIEPGMRAPTVARLLVEKGVLPHRPSFLFRYWLTRPFRSLKAGEYLFDRTLRPIDVYRKLVQGDVYLHTVVIPEGSDRFDMARIFHQQLGIEPERFLRVSEQASAIHDLDPRAETLEGYLFPDTYRFPHDASAATVVVTMLARFRQVLASKFPPDLRQSPDRLHEVITLASMVEKETATPDERPIIAAIFLRRLEKGWPLQCDPTVLYAARLSQRPIAAITQDDLDFDSPYNTYRHAGLPPGPIASPGAASIRAVLNPSPEDFLYFVSNNRGGHIFARTLAQHQQNVARYRREVAALRREANERSEPHSKGASSQRRSPTKPKTDPGKGAKTREQKAVDSRHLPGSESGPHR